MRKLYILRKQEDDGALLDALEARGLGPDDMVNPTCPTCGAYTYLAYTTGDAFTVITWDSLDPDDEADADAWFLTCTEPACCYEEEVERVLTPAGAEPFDLETSEREIDEFLGFTPLGLRQLIEYLQQLAQEHPNRKLECLVDAAQWRYDAAMESIRQWLSKLPVGKRIHFTIDGESMKGSFLTATEDSFLTITQPGGELIAVPAESLGGYGPHYFDSKQEDGEDVDITNIDPDRLIWMQGNLEYVVVRGHHMQLGWTDERFGIYKISSQDEALARELGLRQTADRWSSGAKPRAASAPLLSPRTRRWRPNWASYQCAGGVPMTGPRRRSRSLIGPARSTRPMWRISGRCAFITGRFRMRRCPGRVGDCALHRRCTRPSAVQPADRGRGARCGARSHRRPASAAPGRWS
jgi:hypothetical protein